MKKIILILLLGFIIYPINNKTNYSIDALNYKEGNEVKFSNYLKSKANNTSYNEGNKAQLYTFYHEQTSQTTSLTDYRYIGNDPNNYILFNCDENGDNCETWRIIGIFSVEDELGNIEERVKIIRNSVLNNEMAWDSGSDENIFGTNDWSKSSLNKYLNETYLSSLSNYSKNMIGKTKYYLGSFNTETTKTEDLYINERGLNDNHSKYWIGNIALIYPSDYYYTYANGVDACFNDVIHCSINSDDYEPLISWMYDNGSLDEDSQKGEEWLITSILEDDSSVYRISMDGRLYYRASYGEHLIRPTLYLKSNVYYVSGDGSSNNPYFVKIIEESTENINNSETPNINNDNVVIDNDDINDIDNQDNNTNIEISNDLNIQTEVPKTESKNVDVPSTLSTVSIVLIISSSLLIIIGLIIYGYNYYKLKIK